MVVIRKTTNTYVISQIVKRTTHTMENSLGDSCTSDIVKPLLPSATSDIHPIDTTVACKFRLLDFEKQIFLNVMEKDALVIFAKGLSYWRVVSCVLWVHADPAHLVLVLNASTADEQYLTRHLPLSTLPVLAHERERAYLSGGVVCVSTRVLVVDLLRGRVPVQRVSGVLVLRAHTVLESCQEAFALRLYRRDNKVYSDNNNLEWLQSSKFLAFAIYCWKWRVILSFSNLSYGTMYLYGQRYLARHTRKGFDNNINLHQTKELVYYVRVELALPRFGNVLAQIKKVAAEST